ncbi:glycosyltransferase family 2 protein [Aeromonas caviae]
MKKVISIVVLYNPCGALENILSIANQSSVCYLIDNSSQNIVDKIGFTNPLINYFWLGGNKGIAEAQNVGIKMALEEGCDYIVFFDQDSEILDNTIKNLVASYETLEAIGKRVGLVGPRAFNKINNTAYTRKDKLAKRNFRLLNGRYTNVDYTLSSGSLSAANVFEDVGMMDSSLFIDSVDHEFCWRLVSKGYDIFIDEDVMMPHMLGERQQSFLTCKINIPSPIRHYYVFRNWCILFRLSYVPFSFKVRTLLLLLPKALFFSFLVNPRKKRAYYIIKGIFDGCLGKKGIFK